MPIPDDHGPDSEVRFPQGEGRPISEAAFVGAAIGAASTGLRTIAELMFVDFVGVCMDQILNNAAKMRYMYGGQVCRWSTIRSVVNGSARMSIHEGCDIETARTS